LVDFLIFCVSFRFLAVLAFIFLSARLPFAFPALFTLLLQLFYSDHQDIIASENLSFSLQLFSGFKSTTALFTSTPGAYDTKPSKFITTSTVLAFLLAASVAQPLSGHL
jgi:hypothetical protein